MRLPYLYSFQHLPNPVLPPTSTQSSSTMQPFPHWPLFNQPFPKCLETTLFPVPVFLTSPGCHEWKSVIHSLWGLDSFIGQDTVKIYLWCCLSSQCPLCEWSPVCPFMCLQITWLFPVEVLRIKPLNTANTFCVNTAFHSLT